MPGGRLRAAGQEPGTLPLALRPVVRTEAGPRGVHRHGRPGWRPRSRRAALPGSRMRVRRAGAWPLRGAPQALPARRPAGRSAWIAAGPPVTRRSRWPPAWSPPADCGPGPVSCSATPTRPPGSCTHRPDPAGFAAGYGDEAKLGRDRISLRALPAQLRLEWQYAFQARSDAGRQKVNPGEAQRAVSFTAARGRHVPAGLGREPVAAAQAAARPARRHPRPRPGH